MCIHTYEYKVAQPILPPDCEDHLDTFRNIEWWLNHMESLGWELVSYAQKHYYNCDPQSLWIFRKIKL
jgi:hypothetical protein